MVISFAPPSARVRRLNRFPQGCLDGRVFSPDASLRTTQSSGLCKTYRFVDRMKELKQPILGFATQQAQNTGGLSAVLYYRFKKPKF